MLKSWVLNAAVKGNECSFKLSNSNTLSLNVLSKKSRFLPGKASFYVKSTFWTAQIKNVCSSMKPESSLWYFHVHCSCPKSIFPDIPYCWCHQTLAGKRAQSGPSYAEMWKINWIPIRWNHWCRKWLNTESYSVITKSWKRILQTQSTS